MEPTQYFPHKSGHSNLTEKEVSDGRDKGQDVQTLAMTDDSKVICSGTTLEAVLEEANSKGYDNPVTARIPDLKFEFVL